MAVKAMPQIDAPAETQILGQAEVRPLNRAPVGNSALSWPVTSQDHSATILSKEDKGHGSITLTRHGQPALSRRCLLSSQEYRDWWGRYELGGLVTGQVPPQSLMQTVQDADEIHVSTRLRARETAHAVVGDKPVVLDDLYIEAPLPPPYAPSWFRMSPRLWGVVSRLSWHVFDHHQGQESRRQAEARAAQAAERLIARAEQGQNVLLFAHGYFNHMIGQALKARGWQLTLDQGFKYWCQRRFEKP